MKKKYLIAILLASFILTIGCKKSDAIATADSPVFDMVTAKTKVETRNNIFVAAMNKNDSMGLANCYTKDAKFMQPNGEAVSGRENIQKLFGQWMKAGPMPTFSLKEIDIWGDENLMVVENEWTFTGTDGKLLDKGKSLELWHKEDGTWKLFRDCYNSSLPIEKK